VEAGCFGHGNEKWGSIKCGKFLKNFLFHVVSYYNYCLVLLIVKIIVFNNNILKDVS
jgi:hypothetical protein